MIEKDLFPYNLAAVAIMKDEEHYIKEWLDYHLLTGIDHFYIYDNESTPEFKKILQPYIDAEIVTYIYYPGKLKQMAAYHDAIQRFKFDCRYMTFIDGDEFIMPKTSLTIKDFLDDVAEKFPDAGGFRMHWMIYGSNGQEKADYSRGVLERFTRRALEPEPGIKSIVNPRKANYFWTPHFPMYFTGIFEIDVSAEEIVVNHYHTKSREEYELKNLRGRPTVNVQNAHDEEKFQSHDLNTIFDNSILRYRDKLQSEFIPEGEGIEALFESRKPDYQNVFKTVYQNLMPTFYPDLPEEFFDGRVETFLTCRQMILRFGEKKIISEDDVKFLLQAVYNALQKAFTAKYTVADFRMLLSSIPEILTQPDPFTEKIRELLVMTLSNFQEILQLSIKSEQDLGLWKEISELNYAYRMLKSFEAYEKK